MRILDIEMQHFGKFVHRTIRFSDGLNVIYGRNETGKSTIHAFIRCMLLGMKPGEDGTENRYYDRYFPWQGNGQYDGTLRMAVGGKTYRIERSFLRQAPSLTVVCETDGVRYTDPEEKLQDLLDGLNEASFDNTIGIEQLNRSEAARGEIDARSRELSRDVLYEGVVPDRDDDIGRARAHIGEKRLGILVPQGIDDADVGIDFGAVALAGALHDAGGLLGANGRARPHLDLRSPAGHEPEGIRQRGG